MDSFFNNATELRPTLPPLHSLNLPIPRISRGRAGANFTNTSPTNDLNELPVNNISCWTKPRQVSSSSTSSSSANSNSRTPSPTPSDTSSSSTSSVRSGGFRLVPCSMDVADAVVVVTESTDGLSRPKALLLVGPAAQPYRQPSTRPVTKGARAHPYKIAPSQNLSRRSSMMSVGSQLN